MNKFVRATCVAFVALVPLCAVAQTTSSCPDLPPAADLRWERMDASGLLFCRALRADGSEAFAVTISYSSPFDPRRAKRAEEATIAGQKVHWYRSEIAGQQDAIARETLVEIDADSVAHVSLRASSEEQKQEVMRQVERVTFADARLSSN